MKNILIALFTITLAGKANSQPPGNNIDSLVMSHIKARINAHNNDTIISFQIGFPAMMVLPAYDQNLKGLGVMRVFSVQYLMYVEGNKSYVIKYVDGLDSSYSNNYMAFSNPLLIPGDTKVKMVKNLASKFGKEYIYPSIIKSPGKDYYFVGLRTHTYRYQIGLHSSGDNQLVSFDEIMIEREYCGKCKPPLININYQHNIKTNAYKNFLVIKPLLEKLDNQFEFNRTNLLPAD